MQGNKCLLICRDWSFDQGWIQWSYSWFKLDSWLYENTCRIHRYYLWWLGRKKLLKLPSLRAINSMHASRLWILLSYRLFPLLGCITLHPSTLWLGCNSQFDQPWAFSDDLFRLDPLHSSLMVPSFGSRRHAIDHWWQVGWSKRSQLCQWSSFLRSLTWERNCWSAPVTRSSQVRQINTRCAPASGRFAPLFIGPLQIKMDWLNTRLIALFLGFIRTFYLL